MGRAVNPLPLIGLLLLLCCGAAVVGMGFLGDDPLPQGGVTGVGAKSPTGSTAETEAPPASGGPVQAGSTPSVAPVPARRPRKRDRTLHDAAKKAADARLAALAEAERKLRELIAGPIPRSSETRDGFVEDRDSRGNVLRSGMMAAGIRDGVWTFGYRDGTRVQTTYDMGEKTGLEASWHPDGKPKFQGEYLQGEKHGTWTSWYANGNVRTTQTFHDGEPTGDWLTFHEDGGMAELQTYFDGVQVGLDRGWHADGAAAWEIRVVNGKRHGHAIWWNLDGSVKDEADFEHGKEIAGAE